MVFFGGSRHRERGLSSLAALDLGCGPARFSVDLPLPLLHPCVPYLNFMLTNCRGDGHERAR